jgi:sulfate/thiosulfate transport system permease protein
LASSVAVAQPRARIAGGLLGPGLATTYLSLIVLLPLAALAWRAGRAGGHDFWEAVSGRQAVAAIELTLVAALVVALINAVAGTVLAWVLVRDRFPGQALVNALVDLPFALPTVVAGLTLLALYGPRSPVGVNAAYSRTAVVLALLFVTLPFVVRTVQPTLAELDREMEGAAASLGARPLAIFRRIVLPNLRPAIRSGSALAFGKAIGEFGAVVLISGNIPFRTEVASVHVFSLVETDAPGAAAAVSVVLLALALAVLVAADLVERRGRGHGA